MAGESAAEVAQRLRQKAGRQLEVADHYEKGAAGERATAEALRGLRPPEWVVMHDLAWPGRARANIDHVVVGPAGIFTIDTKNWSGWIEVNANQLRQNGRSRQTVTSGVAEAGLALTRIVSSTTGAAVTPVLCFHRDEPIAGWARDVMVCSTANVVEMLRSRPTMLSPEQVRQTALALDASLLSAVAPRSSAPRVRAAATGSSRPPSRRRHSRTSRLVPAVLGGLILAVVLIPTARTAVTDRVAAFIVSTSTDRGADPPAQPKDATRDDQRPGSNRRTG